MPAVSDTGPVYAEGPAPKPKPLFGANLKPGGVVSDSGRVGIKQPDGTVHELSPQYLRASQGTSNPGYWSNLTDGTTHMLGGGDNAGRAGYIGKDIWGDAHAPINVKGDDGISMTAVNPYAANEAAANARRLASGAASFIPGLGQYASGVNAYREFSDGNPWQGALSLLGMGMAPRTISGTYGVRSSMGFPAGARSFAGGGVRAAVSGLGGTKSFASSLGKNLRMLGREVSGTNLASTRGIQSVINLLTGTGLSAARTGLRPVLDNRLVSGAMSSLARLRNTRPVSSLSNVLNKQLTNPDGWTSMLSGLTSPVVRPINYLTRGPGAGSATSLSAQVVSPFATFIGARGTNPGVFANFGMPLAAGFTLPAVAGDAFSAAGGVRTPLDPFAYAWMGRNPDTDAVYQHDNFSNAYPRSELRQAQTMNPLVAHKIVNEFYPNISDVRGEQLDRDPSLLLPYYEGWLKWKKDRENQALGIPGR